MCIVDNVKLDYLDQTSAEWEWQRPGRAICCPLGTHSLRLVFASGGFITLDAVEVIANPVILTNGVHDDGTAWSVHGLVDGLGIAGPYPNTLHYTYGLGDAAQVAFTGQQIRLTYFASPMSGSVDVYVDGSKVASLDQYSLYWEWQKTWTSDLLPAGTHNLRLVYASGGREECELHQR